MTDPIQKLETNIQEVKRLIEVHKQLAGNSPGRKYNVEVLNKSSIVLLVACWEAYVEDLAEAGFEFMLAKAKDHTVFPSEVLVNASKSLKADPDNRAVWRIAGSGWKDVLEAHKEELFARYTQKLNTPKPTQIDVLFSSLLGISKISSFWHWHTVKADDSRAKLEQLVELRGGIAHRVAASSSVRKAKVTDYMWFVYRLAVRSSNTVRRHVHKHTNRYPWPPYKFRNTR